MAEVRVVRLARWVITVLLVLGVCGFLIDGADRPANPHLAPPPSGARS